MVLLFQEVQSPTRGMSYKNPRKSTLHRQQRTKILAKTIHNKGRDTAKQNFTYFSTIKLHETAERESSSAATATSEPMCGVTSNLQQII
jgi:hypothetical protein